MKYAMRVRMRMKGVGTCKVNNCKSNKEVR